MFRLVTVGLLLVGTATFGQSSPPQPTPPAVVSAIEGVTGKRFVPDTAYAALSDEDKAILAKAATPNWSLAQESGGMTYHNLVVGSRSYQLVIIKPPKDEFARATLIRYTDPKAKPEPIARGSLRPKAADKAD